MAKKSARKNISFLENLTIDEYDSLGLYVVNKGIPKEDITPEIYLDQHTNDAGKSEIGLYHPDDIRYINENYPDLPKEFLWTIRPNLSDNSYFQRGLFVDLFDALREGSELDLSSEFIKLFLKYYSKKENREWLFQKYMPMQTFSGADSKQVEINNTLAKLIEKHEDDIFELVAFDKYKFEEFDKQVVVLLNEHLSKSFPVHGLEYAYKSKSGYRWTGEGIIDQVGATVLPEEKVHKVESSLFFNKVNDYRKPFDFIKGEEGTNDAKFIEGSRFSDFKISNQVSDTTAWFDKGPQVHVKFAYNNFLVKFLNVLELQKSGEISYNDEAVEVLFHNSLADYLNSPIKFSIGSDLAGTSQEFSLMLGNYVAKKFLDDFRFAAWKKAVKIFSELSEDEISKLTADDEKKLAQESFEAGERAALKSDVLDRDPNTASEDELSQAEIEERQKFFKQCALMTRLDEFSNEYEQAVIERAEKINPGNFAYNGDRFYLVKDGDGEQNGIVSKLLLPKASQIEEFLEIEPSAHAYLVPKLRFYKVSQKGSTVVEEEFKFRNFTSNNRVSKLLNEQYDKGGDYGIREFSFSFEGTTPATAKNDIQASLSLYFQTFDDFVDKQPENNSPFVDMLLLSGGTNKKGSGKESRFQFQPDYYRMRVDVGWLIPDKDHKDLKKIIGNNRFLQLKTALQKTNKSFYLNMIDHTIDFRDDGSVQIDVEYRAYIESSLKGTVLDALANRETKASRKKTQDDYLTILNSKRCTVGELNKIKRQLLQIEDLLKKQAYQSIMNRLIKNGFLFFKKLKITSDAENFQRNGFFSGKVKFASDSEEPNEEKKLKEAASGKTFDLDDNFFNEKLSNDEDYLFVNYFYLGDLLYVILDSLYDDNDNYLEGNENFKFILGSLQYEDLFDTATTFKTINIASIPISAELFFEWFTENVIKPERNSYPIMYFIRDLCKYLIGQILSESCFKRSLDKRLQFKTTNFVGIGDQLESMVDLGKPIIDLETEYNNGNVPLFQDSDKKVPISNYTNYILIYVDAPKLFVPGDTIKRGIKSNDGDVGIYHYQIGKDRGLLKKLKFSKTDMQYVREARFFRNGRDGLMQLANVYNVNLDMIGNTLYYPGMEIYINPLGFMGAKSKQFNPTIKQSVANRLGFGGYHLVTNVKSTIAPGKFNTQVTAMFNYSGDGDPSSVIVGGKDDIKPITKEDKIDDAHRPKANKNYCSSAYNKIINVALDISNNKLQSYPGIDIKSLNDKARVTGNVEEMREQRAIEASSAELLGSGFADTGVSDDVREIISDAGGFREESALETLLRQAEEEEE